MPKFYQILFSSLFLGSLCLNLWAVNLDTVEQFEKQSFGFTFEEDSAEKRISRLEREVFGKENKSASLDTRLAELKEFYTVAKVEAPPELIEKAKKEKLQEQKIQQAQNTTSPAPQQQTQNTSSSRRAAPLIAGIEEQENFAELSKMMLDIINQERSFRKLRALSSQEYLSKMAASHASYLVQTKQFSHYGHKGANPDERHSTFGGAGKVSEIIDGFFAGRGENNETIAIEATKELPHQLMDALLQNTDKREILFTRDANQIGIAFVLSPDRDQLSVVIEVVTDYINLQKLPLEKHSGNLAVRGNVGGNLKFAWIGVSKLEQKPPSFETEASPYFAPIDRVIYMDKTASRAKMGAQIGALILGAAAAPFTNGVSLIVADLIMQSAASAYEVDDVEMRSGVNANMNGSFSATIPMGEYGPGLYYLTVWGVDSNFNLSPSKKPKPRIVARRTIWIK